MSERSAQNDLRVTGATPTHAEHGVVEIETRLRVPSKAALSGPRMV
jgi:hypothetical protein